MKQNKIETFNQRLADLDRIIPGHQLPTILDTPVFRQPKQDIKKHPGSKDPRPKVKTG